MESPLVTIDNLPICQISVDIIYLTMICVKTRLLSHHQWKGLNDNYLQSFHMPALRNHPSSSASSRPSHGNPNAYHDHHKHTWKWTDAHKIADHTKWLHNIIECEHHTTISRELVYHHNSLSLSTCSSSCGYTWKGWAEAGSWTRNQFLQIVCAYIIISHSWEFLLQPGIAFILQQISFKLDQPLSHALQQKCEGLAYGDTQHT